MDRKKIFSIILIGAALVVMLGLGVSGITKNVSPVLNDPREQEILDKVSTHFMVPINSSPIVSVIEDVADLKTRQAFYEPAQNGDYLILIPETRKAIIYSEKKDILINVGPIVE